MKQDEDNFRDAVFRHMTNHLRASSAAITQIVATINLVGVIFEQIFANPINKPVLLAGRLAWIILGAGYFAISRRNPRVIVVYWMIVATICNLPFVLPVANLAKANLLASTPGCAPLFVVQAMAIIMLIPVSRLYRAISGIVQWTAFVVATLEWSSQLFPLYVLIAGSFVLAGAVGDMIFSLAVDAAKAQATSELDLSPGGVFELGRTEVKCVMLASDWRGYQALTVGVDPATTADFLARYYDLATALLARHLGGTPFVIDWIADELLICVPYVTELDLTAAAQALVAFARELVIEKNRICLGNGRVPAIDVGIAAGTGTLGLFGPNGRQKLSLVGPALSNARHLQNIGKFLRTSNGDLDRVICDPTIFASANFVNGHNEHVHQHDLTLVS